MTQNMEQFKNDTIESTEGLSNVQPSVRAMAADTSRSLGIVKAQMDYVDAPFRYQYNQNESVKLNEGGLNLTYPDLVLPGKNGFDLNLTRVYDSTMSNERELEYIEIYSSSKTKSYWNIVYYMVNYYNSNDIS